MAKLRRNFQDEVEEDEIYESDDYEDEYEEDEYDDEYDEDEYDEYDEDGDERKAKFIKYGAIGAILAVIVGVALFVRGNQPKTDTKPKTEQVKKSTSSSKKSRPKDTETSSSSSVASNGENAETAKASLERPEAPATAEETATVAGKIEEALAKVKNDPTLKNNQESGLFLTNNTMLNTLQTIMVNDYQFDKEAVRVYKSDNDNVLQFMATFKKDGASDLTLTGNYSPELQQLGFVQMHGELKVTPKVGDTPQVADPNKSAEESDKPLHPEAIQN